MIIEEVRLAYRRIDYYNPLKHYSVRNGFLENEKLLIRAEMIFQESIGLVPFGKVEELSEKAYKDKVAEYLQKEKEAAILKRDRQMRMKKEAAEAEVRRLNNQREEVKVVERAEMISMQDMSNSMQIPHFLMSPFMIKLAQATIPAQRLLDEQTRLARLRCDENGHELQTDEHVAMRVVRQPVVDIVKEVDVIVSKCEVVVNAEVNSIELSKGEQAKREPLNAGKGVYCVSDFLDGNTICRDISPTLVDLNIEMKVAGDVSFPMSVEKNLADAIGSPVLNSKNKVLNGLSLPADAGTVVTDMLYEAMEINMFKSGRKKFPGFYRGQGVSDFGVGAALDDSVVLSEMNRIEELGESVGDYYKFPAKNDKEKGGGLFHFEDSGEVHAVYKTYSQSEKGNDGDSGILKFTEGDQDAVLLDEMKGYAGGLRLG